MESTAKKQEQIIILMIYFFVMLGTGIMFGKILHDIFVNKYDPERIFLSLGCDKILKNDEFYYDNGHSDWIVRCQVERLPF